MEAIVKRRGEQLVLSIDSHEDRVLDLLTEEAEIPRIGRLLVLLEARGGLLPLDDVEAHLGATRSKSVCPSDVDERRVLILEVSLVAEVHEAFRLLHEVDILAGDFKHGRLRVIEDFCRKAHFRLLVEVPVLDH